MADDSVLTGQTFSSTVGLLYVFNLIVGTGALALPRAFQTAGYLLGLILLLVSAFTSYVCATFVLESMAIANCVLRKAPPREQLHEGSIVVEEDVPSSADGEMSEVRVGSVVVVTDGATQHRFSFPSAVPGSDQQQLAHQFIADRHQQPINSDYDISMRVEISEMAHLFLGQSGTVFSYLVLTVYLFGDLAVYSTTVPKSLMNVICSSVNVSSAVTSSNTPCHPHANDLFHAISRFAVYRICIFAFLVFCLPMILMGMTRTKWLQLATTLSRWTAFLLMIVLATTQLIHNGPKGSPEPANLHGFGSLFGVAVYAFMCHHSIPGLITPIRNKEHLSAKLTSVYALVYLFYCAISMTGSFTFENVQDIYTINFLHDDQTAITLCNNIRVLGTLLDRCKRVGGVDRANASAVGEEREALLGDFPNAPHQMDNNSSHLPHFSPLATLSLPHSLLYKFKHFGIPFLVVTLPALISFITDNVLLLASITGSFPGVGVQFVLPAFLILGARRTLSARLGGLSSVPVHSPLALRPLVLARCHSRLGLLCHCCGRVQCFSFGLNNRNCIWCGSQLELDDLMGSDNQMIFPIITLFLAYFIF
uniref:Amino acid transporter transmembrane domain-containing protein n=1 Tax=Globodera rostochiensis TaxID=31243 RepID=A0A914H0D6_GLORO